MLPQTLPYDWKLHGLKSQIFIEYCVVVSLPFQNETFVDTSKNFLKKGNWTFLAMLYFTWKLKFVSNILWMSVDVIIVTKLLVNLTKTDVFYKFIYICLELKQRGNFKQNKLFWVIFNWKAWVFLNIACFGLFLAYFVYFCPRLLNFKLLFNQSIT